MQDLRAYREKTFARPDRPIEFPLWEMTTPALLDTFESVCARYKATVEVSSVDCDAFPALQSGCVKVGDVFNREFVEGLPEGVHPFGENGEFHTKVTLAP